MPQRLQCVPRLAVVALAALVSVDTDVTLAGAVASIGGSFPVSGVLTSPAEKSALLDLYTSANGTGWYNGGWSPYTDPCASAWYGVTCSSISTVM